MSSGLPLKADIAHYSRHVSMVPLPDSCNAAKWGLFDHLVGGATNAGRTFKTKSREANQARPCCSPCAADEHMRAAEVAHVSERHRLVVQELVSAPRKRARPPAISGGTFPFLKRRATRGTAVPAISIRCREENKQP